MIKVFGTIKPARLSATATAHVTVTGKASYDDVLDEGLNALRETKSSLYGYGIRKDGTEIAKGTSIKDSVVVVYAYRD